MKLITKAIAAQLAANAREPDKDHKPVLKLFNPTGSGTWIIDQIDPEEPDVLWGLADLGLGTPEYGTVSLRNLEDYRGAMGLGIERDLHFRARYPMSVYHTAAFEHDKIVETPGVLTETATALGIEPAIGAQHSPAPAPAEKVAHREQREQAP